MQTSESIKEIAIAMCEFQKKIGVIKKTSENPFFKSKYANLSDILSAVQEPLAEVGLSFVQFPSGSYGLETMLMHISGEWIRESYIMTPVKNDPQGAGSVITYQRRYALGAILGLNIDEDDDGNSGSQLRPQAISASKIILKDGSELLKGVKKGKTWYCNRINGQPNWLNESEYNSLLTKG